jgi:hypothetical protein
LDFTFEQNVFRVIFWQMPDSNSSQNTPQFTTAEYSSTAGMIGARRAINLYSAITIA